MGNSLRDKLKKLRRRKRAPRASMDRGLKWLMDQQFSVNTVLDVGASSGRWSQRCIPFFPEADYILFEPQPVHHKELSAFASASEQNVIPVKKAVGASVGTGRFAFDPEDPYSGSLTGDAVTGPESPETTIVVELTTLDSTLSELSAQGPFLLKLDTHGYERSILGGASRTLDDTSILIIEAYNYRITDEAFLFWELCEYLAGRGFRPIDLVDVGHRKFDGSLWQMDLFFIRSTWEGFQNVSYR